MAKEIAKTTGGHASPFERIKRTNDAGMEFWSSREFAGVLGYGDYRNFEAVIEKAKMACFNSGHRIEDHFVDITEMIEIGKGGQRPVKTVLLSRYACYLAIQNADPGKEIVAQGQTYFATQTRRAGLRDPATTASGLGGTIARDLLDFGGKVQCSTCHDAHGPGRGPKLMRFPYDKTTLQGSNMCLICHNK